MVCIYCQNQTSSELPACQHCDQEFPWTVESKRLEDLIKIRETSRLRAAMTFFKDYQHAQKTGDPVPTASVKGLINAWLFRSGALFIAIGAIATTLFGGVQLVILIQQSKIMKAQNTLMERELGLETYNYLKEIKSFFQSPPIDQNGQFLQDYFNKPDSIHYWEIPSSSKIADVVFLSEHADRSKIDSALKHLLNDRNVSIAAGALLSLLKLKSLDKQNSILDLTESPVNLSRLLIKNQAEIRNVKFGEIKLEKTLFINSSLENVKFEGNANFERTLLYNSSFINCFLGSDVKLNKTIITTNTTFENCQLESRFMGCKLGRIFIVKGTPIDQLHFKVCQFYDETLFDAEAEFQLNSAKFSGSELFLDPEKSSISPSIDGLKTVFDSSKKRELDIEVHNLTTF